MLMRPDLFDPHSVHFHGFPNAGAVFDGVPESSISINMGFSLTYYYNIVEARHLHVPLPRRGDRAHADGHARQPVRAAEAERLPADRADFDKFVYNDGDGSTGYDVEVPIQIGSMDPNFHDEHIGVQPLPFAQMHDDYPMLNGRGYPDTVNPAAAAGGRGQGSFRRGERRRVFADGPYAHRGDGGPAGSCCGSAT